MGAGRMGGFHAAALRRGRAFTLVGVVDPTDPEWSGVPWSADLGLALERLRPDAVIVATPPTTHAPIAQVCLDAGCDVLLEKPVCPDPGEARRLAEEFRRCGRVLFGGHSERFHPVFLRLREELPRTGGWRTLRCHRLGPSPESRPEGGAILDLAIHDLDLALRLDPALELAEVRHPGTGPTESILSGSDRTVSVTAGYLPSRRRTWELETDDGTWHADFLGGTLARHTGSGAAQRLEIGPTDALEREHEAFRAALEGSDWWSDLQPQIRAVELAREILAKSPVAP